MEEESDEQTEVRIAIELPEEAPEADTDQDNDGSDDEVTCNPVHLPRRILLSNVLSRNTDNDHPHIESIQSLASEPTKRRKKAAYKWHDNILQVVNLVPDYDEVFTAQCVQAAEKNDEVASEQCGQEAETNPLKMFEERYWTEEWIATLCEQSKNYAHQKGIPCTEINAENMKVFLAILILSGYNKVPNRRLHWSESPDKQNKLVIDSMRRDTFEQIMRCLHFNDNMAMDGDRFFKVRPLFEHLNQANKDKKKVQFYSIDEIMVAYYGRHGDKQYIREKPVRFGFKLWAICTSDGFLHHAEPYCGNHTKVTDKGFGLGGNVVLQMIENVNMQPGQHAVFDNFFGSVALLEELASKKIAATCTLQEDRLSGAPMKIRKTLDKMERRTMDEAFTS